MKTNKVGKLVLSLLFCTLATIGSIFAQTATWNGGTNGLLNTNTWLDGNVPSSGYGWVFTNSLASSLTNNFSSGFNVGGMSFSSSAAALVINGGTVNLTGGITNNSLFNQTISTALIVNTNVTFTNGLGSGANSYISIVGNISGSGTITYGVTNGGSRLQLSGSNSSFTGAVYFNSGRVQISKSNSVSSLADYYLNNSGSGGAGVYLAGTSGSVYTFGSLNGTNTNVLVSANGGNTTNTIEVGARDNDSFFAGNISSNNLGTTGVLNLVKKGIGTFSLINSNTMNGTFTVNNGVGQLGNGGGTGKLQNATIVVNDTGTFAIKRSNTVTQGVDFSSNAISGTGSFGQYGTGTTILNAVNTFSGNTYINSGTLKLASTGSINNSAEINIKSTYDVSSVSNYILQTGHTISGTGTLVGSVNNSGTISPGSNNIGTLTMTGNQSWLVGGSYNWDVYDYKGIAGNGFDQVKINGSLSMTNLTSNSFTINVGSLLTQSGGIGAGTNYTFEPFSTNSWVILKTTGGINGFDNSSFNLNFNNFRDDLYTASSFYLSTDGNNLSLNLVAVPEPSVIFMAGFLLVFVIGLKFRDYIV